MQLLFCWQIGILLSASVADVFGQTYLAPLYSKITSLESSISYLRSQVSSQNSRISQQSSTISQQKTALALITDSFQNSGANPVAHVYGHYSSRFTSGTVLNQWSQSKSHPSILAGGMMLSYGGLIVPFTGIYYIYGQLLLDAHSGDSASCGFSLRVNSRRVAASHTYHNAPTGSDGHTKYTGVVRPLNKGDNITMQIMGSCTLDSHSLGEAFLGAFFVSFTIPNNNRPAAQTYDSYSGGRSDGSLLTSWGNYYIFAAHGAASNSYGVTVSASGLYFVFGQQQFRPQSSGKDCGFRLQVGSHTVSEVFRYTTRATNEAHSQYTGRVVQISSGQRLQMHSRHGCYISNNYSFGTFLGVFYLPFQAGPAIHLTKITSGTFYTGSTLSIWNTVPSVNNGNLRHSSTGFVVPRDGIYYVYAQLQFDPVSAQKNCACELVASSNVIAASHNWVSSPNGSDDKVIYTGSAAYLHYEDTVSVKVRGTCFLDANYKEEAFLGGFFLHN